MTWLPGPLGASVEEIPLRLLGDRSATTHDGVGL